jgi:hypothetical protein
MVLLVLGSKLTTKLTTELNEFTSGHRCSNLFHRALPTHFAALSHPTKAAIIFVQLCQQLFESAINQSAHE